MLLCIAACTQGAAQRPVNSTSHPPSPRLSFGRTIAFSDFDADGLMDQARVANWGAHRSVKVVLSRSNKPLILHFENGAASQGSLFVQDVDDDGAADLIWTDLLHAECVVIWLGNGDGKFARASADLYADGYTLPDQSLNAPDQTIHETSIGSASNRSPLEARYSTDYTFVRNQLPKQRLSRLVSSSLTFDEPDNRGPPVSLF